MSEYDDVVDAGSQASRGRRRQRHAGWRRALFSRRSLAVVSIITTFFLVAATLTAYAEYRSVWDSIKRIDVAGLTGTRPHVYSKSLNVLIIGSDTRAGRNRQFGASLQGHRSDTMLLLHISPGHKKAVVVSFPRDSLVPILACKADGLGDPGQPAQPGATEMLNATFAYGGPACLWKTVQFLTKIPIDHFVELNFSGFEHVINDLGGVTVCLPTAVNDPKSGLNLSAGKHHVWGAKALVYWRLRSIGEGSDLQRIQRDQYLMASLVQEVRSSGLLGNYPALFHVVTDAAHSMTTDSGLDQSAMVRIASSMKGLSSQSVVFVTVPNGAAPSDPNRVVWLQPQSDALFAEIAHDKSVNKPKKGTKGGKPGKKTTPVPTIKPSQVQVQVLNGTSTPGLGGSVAAQLLGRGFDVTGAPVGAAGSNFKASVIRFDTAAQLPAVNTLRAQLDNVMVVHRPTSVAGSIDLIVGSSFHGLRSTTGPGIIPGNYGGIAGNTNVCKDTSAFAGPNG